MTNDASALLAAIRDYLVPTTGPIATGVVGFLAGQRQSRANAAKTDAETDQIALTSITDSFNRLIEGYERRIEDLTAEIVALREEVKSLRNELYCRIDGHV